MRRPHYLSTERGLSIVELVIVMAVLSIVMMAIMSFIIPTQQSMKMQSNVTDVQSNLNLAINVMSKDLLMAGFLVPPNFDPPTTDANCPTYWKGDNPGDDMAAGPIFWQGDDITEDVNDLTIRTRIVGDAFAIINEDASTGTPVKTTHADMLANFCNCTDTDSNGIWNSCDVKSPAPKVRIFDAISMAEPGCGSANYACEMTPATVAASLFTITACDEGSSSANTDDTITLDQAVERTNVIVGTRAGALPMQTIRYRVNNNSLERIVNGTPQILARGVTSINFAYGKSISGAVNRVDVTLTGVIAAMKSGEAQLNEKTRSLTTSVTLRNVF